MYRPDSALLTDLYQLTMLSGYFHQRMDEIAVFELFSRKLPRERSFLLAAGLEQALEWLEGFRFTPEELTWLSARGGFAADFVEYLAQLRFTGDVYAMPEGTVFFPDEPILRVVAPLPEAQVVESRLINILHLQTVIASKAARCVLVAPEKLLVDFGLRRAHGAEAGLFAARASYLAGFAGTATVLAEQLYGVPSFGTLAHSFIQSHADERAAFEHFAHAQPHNVVLLIDTYDTEEGARRVVELAPRLRAAGIPIRGVRLDSGDLAAHARQVRKILDAGGLRETTIFSSGSLDEYALSKLLSAGAPIDGFGIGTHLDTSSDAPYLDCAYKLQEYAGLARRKRSEGKATWPGRKQVYRQYDRAGSFGRDVVTLEDDRQPGEPLIEKVMANGRRIAPSPSLAMVRQGALDQLTRLPARLRGLEPPESAYPVEIARAVRDLAAEVDRRSGLS